MTILATDEEQLNDATRRPAIDVAALSKLYPGGVLANDEIDLRVPAGCTLGLLGYNGAGKTTLVRQITGELQPTSGNVRVLGTDVVRDPTAARTLMGVVPQEAEPYEHLTPREHLGYFARLHGVGRAEAKKRTDDLIDVLGLAPHASKMSRTLSGGLKRKLLVGNALIGDPPVLVLDEPTTGLDPHGRREVWSLLRTLSGRGRTIVMTTHYMEEAEELCDEVALISRGRVYIQGTVAALRAHCRNRFRATYDGEHGRCTTFGQTSDEVLAELADRGIDEFMLSKTTLEDVYMELVDEAREG